MSSFATKNIRNVVLVGHGSAGKTSLTEAMLFDTGAVNRLGRVEDGSSVSDWDDEERRRKVSINTSVVPCEWKGVKINVLEYRHMRRFEHNTRRFIGVIGFDPAWHA